MVIPKKTFKNRNYALNQYNFSEPSKYHVSKDYYILGIQQGSGKDVLSSNDFSSREQKSCKKS